MLRESRFSSIANLRAACCGLLLSVLMFAQPLAVEAVVRVPGADALAHRAQSVAGKMDTVGWCYAGVKQALRSFGVALTGAAAWMAAEQLKNDKRFNQVKQSSLQRGDILVHDRSSTHPYGHIAVYLGDGAEASDHLQHLVVGGHYGPTSVFRLRNSSRATIALRDTHDSLPRLAHVSKAAPRSVAVARIAVASGAKNTLDKTSRSQPQTTKTQAAQPVDPTLIAQAKKQADLYQYLYSQGAVSRNDAESKLNAYRRLQNLPETKLATSAQPAGPSS